KHPSRPNPHRSLQGKRESMTQAAGIFRTPWFYHRPVLAPEGQYVTVTEVAEWARAPYDDLRRHLIVRRNGDADAPAVRMLAPSCRARWTAAIARSPTCVAWGRWCASCAGSSSTS